MENSVKITRSFNARPPIADAKGRQSKLRYRIFSTTCRRVIDYLLRSPPERFDELTPHLRYDIGLIDIRHSRREDLSSTPEDIFPRYR
jgi:hypothetical protein